MFVLGKRRRQIPSGSCQDAFQGTRGIEIRAHAFVGAWIDRMV